VLAVAGGGLAAGALALTGGLAAFCFVKAFGVAFLGAARSHTTAEVAEAPLPMLAAMGGLALLCVGLGLFPSLLLENIAGIPAASLAATLQAPVTAPAGFGAGYAPVAMAAAGVGLAVLALLTVRLVFGGVAERIAPPWVCGVLLEPRMQYTSSALAKPVRIVFQRLLRPYRAVQHQYAQAAYVVTAVHYEGGIHPVYESYLYRPALGVLLALSSRVRRLQNGSLRMYLSYIFVTLVVVLVLTR